jgi:hypothetical protein
LQTERNQVAPVAAERFYLNLDRAALPLALHPRMFSGLARIAIASHGRTIWIVDAHRDDGRRFIVRADEILSAFIEPERQVLTVTFYLESIQ